MNNQFRIDLLKRFDIEIELKIKYGLWEALDVITRNPSITQAGFQE